MEKSRNFECLTLLLQNLFAKNLTKVENIPHSMCVVTGITAGLSWGTELDQYVFDRRRSQQDNGHFVLRWNTDQPKHVAQAIIQRCTYLKCICIETFDNFLLANTKDRHKPKRKLFYCFLISVSVPEI